MHITIEEELLSEVDSVDDRGQEGEDDWNDVRLPAALVAGRPVAPRLRALVAFALFVFLKKKYNKNN
jgi:hypothetical protein